MMIALFVYDYKFTHISIDLVFVLVDGGGLIGVSFPGFLGLSKVGRDDALTC